MPTGAARASRDGAASSPGAHGAPSEAARASSARGRARGEAAGLASSSEEAASRGETTPHEVMSQRTLFRRVSSGDEDLQESLPPQLETAQQGSGHGILTELLEQALRESLQELARSTADAAGGGGGQSLDGIVRSVAAKVVDEARANLVVDDSPSAREPIRRELEEPPPPLLEDLQAIPLFIWREREKPLPSAARSSSEEHVVADVHYTSTMQRHVRSWEEAAQPIGAGAASPDAAGHGEAAAGAPPRAAAAAQPAALGACAATPPSLALDLGAAALQEAPQACPGPSAWSPRSTPIVVRNGLALEEGTAQHMMMQWQRRPQAVLLVAKPKDSLIAATVQDIASWLGSQGIVVVLEQQFLSMQPHMRRLPGVRTFSGSDVLEKRIDLVVTIGGDGTLTWATSLFRGAMPPVLAFAAGSLGFLTPFPLDGWIRTFTGLLDFSHAPAPVRLGCRMRLHVRVSRRSTTRAMARPEDARRVVVQCLNEVLVHRGNSGALCKLDVGVDGERVTLVQGDGVILATPTGSTAYSLAAGGSMVHPAVPAILLTPVSPHSLSFRPALLPESATVTVTVPLTAKNGAALSVDGKDICTLMIGDSVEVAVSHHPVPTICRFTETGDWFASVNEALHWNGRKEQK